MPGARGAVGGARRGKPLYSRAAPRYAVALRISADGDRLIGSVLAHIVEGLIRPRASMETLLERDPGAREAALMVLAAYALQRGLDILIGPGAETMGLLDHLVSIVVAVAFTFLIGFLLHVIGRAFGGQATREQALAAAGWHALVMTLLWPLVLIGVGDVELVSGAEMSLGAFLALAFYFSQWIWLLARYTAAIHGFDNEWNVVGVILGVSLLFSALILLVSGA